MSDTADIGKSGTESSNSTQSDTSGSSNIPIFDPNACAFKPKKSKAKIEKDVPKQPEKAKEEMPLNAEAAEYTPSRTRYKLRTESPLTTVSKPSQKSSPPLNRYVTKNRKINSSKPKRSVVTKMKVGAPSFEPRVERLYKSFGTKYEQGYIDFIYDFTGERYDKANKFLTLPLKEQLELMFYRRTNANPCIDFEAKAKGKEDIFELLDSIGAELHDEETPYYDICLKEETDSYNPKEQSEIYDNIFENWSREQVTRINISGLDEDVRYRDLPKAAIFAPIFEQDFRNNYKIDIRSHYKGTPVDIVFNLFVIEECDSDKVLEHVATLYDIPRTSEDPHIKSFLAKVDKNSRKAEIALANFDLDLFEYYEQKISGFRKIIYHKMGLEPRVFVQNTDE